MAGIRSQHHSNRRGDIWFWTRAANHWNTSGRNAADALALAVFKAKNEFLFWRDLIQCSYRLPRPVGEVAWSATRSPWGCRWSKRMIKICKCPACAVGVLDAIKFHWTGHICDYTHVCRCMHKAGGGLQKPRHQQQAERSPAALQ